MDGYHSIKAVSRQTGLTAHVIRIWEKRYGAVKPARSEGRRRLYSDAEVSRLQLLAAATREGHSIGNIAGRATEELERLVKLPERSVSKVSDEKDHAAQSLIERGVRAVQRLDGEELMRGMDEAMVQLGTHGLLQRVLGPMAERVGELWQQGEITAAHEHFATAVMRDFLARSMRPYAPAESAPVLVVATPTGQIHELGAMMVAAAAGNVGWRVVYLGASLPAPEIAGPAIQHRARAVALSLVYPEDDPKMAGELEWLRRLLPPEIGIIAGGRAAPAYHATLRSIGAAVVSGLDGLYPALAGLRRAGVSSQ